ncbi:uncharacterized protein LOC118438051 isoform X2 [Folsomia candida]|uniref:uncharacterized protein LOC118438051 isoform X2 n=1 Tax=Folsomia candida TaxID=158441 RepID=UPI00160548DE|nr:uncharacterized protein LOC118438051 isoform X2 [Folsomia candida]
MQAEVDQLRNLNLVANIDAEVGMKALFNPLILYNVFSSLDTPTLKSVRLVCTLWADVGTTFLGKQALLTYSIPPNPRNCKELTSFNPELARNIALQFYKDTKCCYNYPCTCPPNVTNLPPNFVLILPEISDKLETLKFSNLQAFELVQEIWCIFNFSNLTHLWITVNGKEHGRKVPPPPPQVETAEFRPLPNLKAFFLEISPICREYWSKGVMTFCQNLVNSAPHLEEVDLTANFYLDMKACGKLKNLRFNYDARSGLQFKTGEMTKMLESCRDSLESLTLDHTSWYESLKEVNLHLPNLTHLGLNNAHSYIIKDSLNVTNLPKVTHFSMSSIFPLCSFDIFAMDEPYHLRHIGITSLDLSCVHCPFKNRTDDGEAAGRLVNLFPAVKELKLKLIIQGGFDQYFLGLMGILQSFGDWELTSGQVEFEIFPEGHNDYEFGSKLIIAVLGGMAGWRV